MSIRKFVRQIRPTDESYTPPIDKVQSYFSELTVTPHYQQKGVYNPFYTLNIDVEKDIRPTVGKGVIKFQNVLKGQGKLLKAYGRGKFIFQIVVDDNPTQYYITTIKTNVTGHLGMRSRKSATASSDVNEFLSLYFMKHPTFSDARTFIVDVSKMGGDTGIMSSSGSVTYETLNELLDKDETAERDVNIGYNNSKAVLSDLKSRGLTWSVLHWVPQAKPGGIRRNNPSDIIIELDDGTFTGYSNKISAGKDATPKLNTGIWSAYQKLGDRTQISNIENMIDKAWNDAASKITMKTKNAYQALKRFNISRERFSETTSQAKFADLAKEFDEDGLKFFFDDMYYPFRNNLISAFAKHIKNPVNMKYLINTVGLYTYGDPAKLGTPCSYKLLIGGERSSTLKDIVSDDSHREIFFSDNPRDFIFIKTRYDNKSQSFNVDFTFSPSKLKVSFPMTLRTRASGGWGGKNLYMTTSGFKIT